MINQVTRPAAIRASISRDDSVCTKDLTLGRVVQVDEDNILVVSTGLVPVILLIPFSRIERLHKHVLNTRWSVVVNLQDEEIRELLAHVREAAMASPIEFSPWSGSEVAFA